MVAWILTNTSFARGTGASTSPIRTTSGAPYLVCTAALMNADYRAARGRPIACGRYRLKAIARRISTAMKTTVNARSIDSPPARTGRSTLRTGAITGSVQV